MQFWQSILEKIANLLNSKKVLPPNDFKELWDKVKEVERAVGHGKKYTAEQTGLKEKIASLSLGLEEVAQAKTDVDEFIRRLKLCFNSPTLTREN